MSIALPAEPLAPVPMEEAAGYPIIDCAHQTPVEHALILKHNRYFLIANQHGDIAPPGQCSLGLFHDDTRILSHYALSVRGGPPSLLSGQSSRAYAGQIDLAVSDEEFGGSRWDPKNCIHIRRELFIEDRFIERLTLTNYLSVPIDYWVELALASDFADIFEVRGWKREKRGQFFAPQARDGMLICGYQGQDGELLRTVVRFRDPPPVLHAKGAGWKFNLSPNMRFETAWEIYAGDPGERRVFSGFQIEERQQRMERVYQTWTGSCSHWTGNNAEWNSLIRRAVDDLRALHVECDGQSILSAGIPWYSTAFGRDSIIASLQTLMLNPAIARETLFFLAGKQGSEENSFTEEQPGKILHELRRGEMARNGEIPHVPYYGTIDATPLWLILLHETWRWTGDDAMVRQLFPNAERALDWIERYADVDGDGFADYFGHAKGGLTNQGWKDSGDGVPYPDGTLPKAPIALVEVQGYIYDAKIRMAELQEVFGDRARAEALRKEAERFREAILDRFWVEELGFFALALDGDKQVVPTITSNAGHLLWNRVPRPEQAARMAEQFMGPKMFSGWGIRTLSSDHRVFNPMSYHNGSIWPHDNAIVVMGLAGYGLAGRALPVLSGLYEAAIHDEFERLPELFCGMPRSSGLRPVQYPVSCSPQAWASGAFFMLLQSVLGIYPEAPARVLHIQNPILPRFLDHLTISNLQVGNSKLSLQFRRHKDRTLANLLSIEGEPLQVRIELS